MAKKEREAMSTEEVMGQAAHAALYFRRLVDEGVPVTAAISLTGSFVSAQVLRSGMSGGEPTEPWDGGNGDGP